jgi:hypothetical protein
MRLATVARLHAPARIAGTKQTRFHAALASRFKSVGHLPLICVCLSRCQRRTTDCGLTSRLRCRSGNPDRHCSIAPAFSCNATAHERVAFGIEPKPCAFIHLLSVAGFQIARGQHSGHRRRIIDAFRRQHGTKPLKGLRREHIVQIMADKAETPEAANNLIKLLRVMLNYRSTNNKFLVAQLQQGFAASETGSRDGFAVQNSWALHVH